MCGLGALRQVRLLTPERHKLIRKYHYRELLLEVRDRSSHRGSEALGRSAEVHQSSIALSAAQVPPAIWLQIMVL